MERILKKTNRTYQSPGFHRINLKDANKSQTTNITIDFNVRGEIINPCAPYTATTIDPEYTENVSMQRRIRKFRLKTDILTLREITRKKFMIYATQQRYMEKQREAVHQDRMYRLIRDSQEFAANALRKSVATAFTEMKQSQQKLGNLQSNKVLEELEKTKAEHQRVLMEVQEIYNRFLFLLKLIGYFDEITAPENIDGIKESEECKLPQLAEIVDLQINEQNPVGEKEVLAITDYMNKIVRPYLAKRNCFNPDIWVQGYEETRKKMFNYNRRFHQLAWLNHLVAIAHFKSEKTFHRSMMHQKHLKDPQVFKRRIDFLKNCSLHILDNFEKIQSKDLTQVKLSAILPNILENIQLKLSHINENTPYKMRSEYSLEKTYTDLHLYTLEKIEKLQCYLMILLQDLDKISYSRRNKIEKEVRKRIQAQKDISKRALVKQNLLHNWIKHFKKHALHQ